MRHRWMQLVDALVPGMPPAARAKITAQAQGIPLFAVETVRSLVDRDIVQPVEGVYRLVGDVGQLQVPDSLHALLAARLDALDPDVRRLVADAAVLGTTFPAEALIAVSGQAETAVRAALAELVRREVLTVSADPLSPELGSYGFAQDMLRQVAYDTLSRRDRKARHLAVAAHLRAAFPGDGEEVADVIARHYLDALDAVPDDPDAGQIRGQAIAALTRAAERAGRTGAPALAAASYAAAARLTQADDGARAANRRRRVVGTRRRGRPHQCRLGRGGRAGRPGRGCCTGQGGGTRAAARAQAIAGQALRRWGRHAQAREQLTAAVEVLRDDPDADTVRALGELAALEVFAGSPDADPLSAEALALGQDLAVDEAASPACSPPAGSTTARRAEAAGGRLLPGGRPAGRAGRRPRPARPRAGQPVRRGERHRPRRRRGGRPRRRRPAAPGRRPRPPCVRGREPGPGAADDRRLGRRRGRAGPGRRRRRASRHRVPGLLPGLAGGAARRRPRRPGDPGRRWATCGPAKTPRTRRKSRSRRRSPPPRSASPPPRCATPAPPWTTPTR